MKERRLAKELALAEPRDFFSAADCLSSSQSNSLLGAQVQALVKRPRPPPLGHTDLSLDDHVEGISHHSFEHQHLSLHKGARLQSVEKVELLRQREGGEHLHRLEHLMHHLPEPIKHRAEDDHRRVVALDSHRQKFFEGD